MLLKALQSVENADMTVAVGDIFPIEDQTGRDLLNMHPNLFVRAPDDALDVVVEAKPGKKGNDRTPVALVEEAVLVEDGRPG